MKKDPSEANHPAIKEYESLLNNSNIDRKEWDTLFLEFYTRNREFIDNIESLDSDLAITRVIGMKIVYSRIVDANGEYKEGMLIAEDLATLLEKLDEEAFNYQETYLNAKKWIGIHFNNNKKYRKSNKVLSEIAQLNKEKVLHKEELIKNITRPLNKIATIANGILFAIAMLHILITPLPLGVIIIVLLLFAFFLGASLNMEKIVAYFINKKIENSDEI